MKIFVPAFTVLLLASCAHNHGYKTTSVSHPERGIANVSGIAMRFLSEAAQSGDNLAIRSVSDMQTKLIKQIQTEPSRFGMTQDAANKLKKLDDIQDERILSEVLSEAPTILGWGVKARNAAMASVSKHSGIASQIALKSVDVSKVKVSLAFQTGFGRRTSQNLQDLKSHLVTNKLASQAQATKIVDEILDSAKTLAAKAKGDSAQMLSAQQIIDYSISISRKTGKSFLGKGGCMKIGGAAVLENKAEIAYRTLKDVDASDLRSYDEIGESLQKNHSEVTNRTPAEACLSIKELTVGKSCGGVYSPSLKPTSC